MSWNWGFFKSLLFGFLGFLFGIVSTVIYLALDVDLSQFDGLQILTAVLIAGKDSVSLALHHLRSLWCNIS